jgi:hypothetical protein
VLAERNAPFQAQLKIAVYLVRVPKYKISEVRSVIESPKAVAIGRLFRHGFTKCCTK